MSLPLVSIIIPTYNQRSDFLQECLESAIGQTYSNIEIIVSDNHSTNESISVLEKFPRDKFKIIKPPQHLEVIDHFSFAAAAATGEYISFLSSDDLLYPDCIAKVISPLTGNKKLCFSYCETAIIDEAGKCRYTVRKEQMSSGIYQNKEIAVRIYKNTEHWIIGGVIRNEYFKKVGFIKDIRAGDWLLGIRLLKYGDVAYCNEVLSAIRIHDRLGDTKNEYAEQYILHNMQRVTRHEVILKDQELLEAIGISQGQAVSYRNKEILKSVVVLVRQYHKRLVSKDTVNKIFEFYKQTQSGFSFNYLTRFYPSKPALFYTYLLSLYRKIF
jgi:glycosyltransferase involved in cell wall biosynthesis